MTDMSDSHIRVLADVVFIGLCAWLGWIWGGYFTDLLLHKLRNYVKKYE
jgi:hypothetical protein